MKRFNAQRVERSHMVTISDTREAVFPLLCPVREKEWIPGWDNDTYELIYSESGFNETGCIFRTAYPDGIDSLWVCTKYDKETFEAEFVVLVRDLLVRKMRIFLEKKGDRTTDATFTFTLTAVTEAGNRAVEKGDGEAASTAARLGMMLNHFLKTGEKLVMDGSKEDR